MSYDVGDKQWDIDPLTFPNYIYNARLLWTYNDNNSAINDGWHGELHVICNEGDETPKVVHYLVQPFYPNRKCIKMHEFTDIEYATDSGPNILYVAKRQIIILYDESSTIDNENLSTMHVYSVIDKTWHKRTVNIRKSRSQFGFVATDDGQYVIILGGIYAEDVSEQRMLDDILIWDLDTDRVEKSIISCPFAGPCKAVIMGGSHEWFNRSSKTAHTVNAYILDTVPELHRELKYTNKESNRTFLMLCEMIVPEIVHILDESGNHWELDLCTILTASK